MLLPSAVNFEGFILSHDKERVRLLKEDSIHRFLGRPRLEHKLDPSDPLTFGAIATPDTYYEFRMQQNEAMNNALTVFDEVEDEFEAFSGRRYGAIDAYNAEEADTVMVINGSSSGTMRAAARELNAAGARVGVLSVKLFRPFPAELLVSHLKHASTVITMDRSISPGAPCGPLGEDVRAVLHGAGVDNLVMGVVYGIGGRDVSKDDGKKIFSMAREGRSFGGGPIMYGVKG